MNQPWLAWSSQERLLVKGDHYWTFMTEVLSVIQDFQFYGRLKARWQPCVVHNSTRQLRLSFDFQKAASQEIRADPHLLPAMTAHVDIRSKLVSVDLCTEHWSWSLPYQDLFPIRRGNMLYKPQRTQCMGGVTSLSL
jgi:hypothetical protein